MNDFEIINNGKTTYLQYPLKKNQIIDSTSSGMLLNNDIFGLAPVSLGDEAGELVIRYEIGQLVSLAEMIENGLSEGAMISIMRKMTKVIIHAEDYLLELTGYCYDKKYVFLDMELRNIRMIFIPVEKYSSEINFREFCRKLIEEYFEKYGRNQGYLKEVDRFLAQGKGTLTELLQLLESEEMDIKLGKKKGIELTSDERIQNDKPEIEPGNVSEEKKVRTLERKKVVLENSKKAAKAIEDTAYRTEPAYVLHKQTNDEIRRKAGIVRESTQEEIIVEGINFIIGQSSELCQYSVTGNAAVSNRHARITKKKDGTYWIEDLFSTNGTFVDGMRIYQGHPTELRNGSRIFLADEQFTFHILI